MKYTHVLVSRIEVQSDAIRLSAQSKIPPTRLGGVWRSIQRRFLLPDFRNPMLKTEADHEKVD